MIDKMALYQKSDNWIATAKRSDNSFVAIMTTASQDGKLCLYDENFTFDPNNQPPLGFGPETYSCEDIASKFSSGEWSLVGGKVPLCGGEHQ